MSLENELKPKSFWERKEGTTGMFVIGGLVALFAYFAPVIMALFATMITVLGQAITLTVLGAVLFGIVMILSNSKFQTLVSYMFKSAMRKVTGLFVEIDPIGIMKNYIQDAVKKRGVMEESIGKLRGQIVLCEKSMKKNQKVYDDSVQTYKVARDKNMTAQAQIAARQMERMDKANKQDLGPLYDQM